MPSTQAASVTITSADADQKRAVAHLGDGRDDLGVGKTKAG